MGPMRRTLAMILQHQATMLLCWIIIYYSIVATRIRVALPMSVSICFRNAMSVHIWNSSTRAGCAMAGGGCCS
eukprot:5906408-Heterocapsa_arctica.AAC.1